MPEIVLYMTMSLDGFITGPHDDKDNPLGLDGGRLFNHGAGAAQALLRSGLLDQMGRSTSCLSCSGEAAGRSIRWGPEHVELELVRNLDAPGVTHLRYRVRAGGSSRYDQ